MLGEKRQKVSEGEGGEVELGAHRDAQKGQGGSFPQILFLLRAGGFKANGEVWLSEPNFPASPRGRSEAHEHPQQDALQPLAVQQGSGDSTKPTAPLVWGQNGFALPILPPLCLLLGPQLFPGRGANLPPRGREWSWLGVGEMGLFCPPLKLEISELRISCSVGKRYLCRKNHLLGHEYPPAPGESHLGTGCSDPHRLSGR